MSILDLIKTRSRAVVASGILSESWEYATRTSSPTSSPTKSAWTAIDALQTDAVPDPVEYDDNRAGHVRKEHCYIRFADTGPSLKPGDLMRKASAPTVHWAVLEQVSSAGGTLRFHLVRDISTKSQPNRNGGDFA